MVMLIRSDLEFILQQILISEDHAAGRPLVDFADPANGLLPSPQLSFGLRTVDGSLNNLYPGQSNYGQADQVFPRLLTPNYRPSTTFDPDGPGGAPAFTNSIVAPELRMISNLVVDVSSRNPAAAEAAGFDLALGLDGIAGTADDGQHVENLFVGNSAPDEGLSAGFNSWFTFFGQFFDHGLDLVNKGGNGIVYVPLSTDDPLYDEGPDGVAGTADDARTNFMVLTRATHIEMPGADGVLLDNPNTAADESADNTFEHTNQTTPFVDQNQTYTSHPSHQVFLREYEMVSGRPVATGELLNGVNGGLPTWNDVKAQAATMLGINLTDADVTNLPLLATDEYGRFLRGPNGFAQVVMRGNDGVAGTADDILVEGNPAAPINLANAVRTGHAFLDDIAHNAVPVNGQTGAPLAPDADTTIDDHMTPRPAGTYDDELLGAHKITGDGRGNENIALTAVHHIFHAEHNRLVGHVKDVILQTGDLAFINQWLDVPVATVPTNAASVDWNGERLFQAARFGTEMQYQHLVFEEFARKIQPLIGDFIFPIGYQADLNPAIFAEFAHAVYRFGHSMLTETVDRLDPNFASSDIGLIDAFLNPVAFDNNGAIDAEVAAGSIVRGMTRQLGSEIDEFVTGAVRNNLLGLPLDLATINLARGRDAGIPTLNEARREIYSESGLTWMKPYESWVDFAGHLKNEMSILNFIAAYGTHPAITGATTLADKRAAATTLVLGDGNDADGVVINGVTYTDRLDFLNGTGAWANTANGVTTTGLDNVDLWIGGLAEEIAPFGGMLGSTFNFIFEVQLETLQDGDRFYYLQRLHGMNFLNELENNSFAALIMRNTDATHLPGDVFSTPGLILEVDQTRQHNLDENGVYTNADPVGGGILTPLVVRGPNSVKYTGDEHVVLGGTDANDTLIASIGDDTLWGDGGNDRMEGGHGNDILHGGDGHDLITDVGGDDTIHGEEGNDVISAGAGLNLVLGGGGSDFIISGSDADSQSFGGRGNDFIIGGTPNGAPFGNEGDDWIEGGLQDGAAGDNEDPFGQDPIQGHDVYVGDGGFDEMVGEGGDDMMHSSLGLNRMEGGTGFDWGLYHMVPGSSGTGVYVDLLLNAFDETPLPPTPETSIDRYAFVEGISGSSGNDTIFGDNEDGVIDPLAPEPGQAGNELTQAGVDRIAGLRQLMDFAPSGNPDAVAFTGGNILLGGAGDDRIMGRGGNDFIDGDHRVNVRISVRANADGTGPELFSAATATALIPQMLSGAINPGQLVIVREIVDDSSNDDVDTAVFSDAEENYDVINNGDGSITVIHARGTQADGTDTLWNIEQLQFGTAAPAPVQDGPATGLPTILIPTALREGSLLQSSVASISDPDGIAGATFAYQWEELIGATWTAIAGATASTFTPTDAQVTRSLRLRVSFIDDAGGTESVVSSPTNVVGDLFTGTPGADNYFGTAGSDQASGLGGNDTLDGGLGADRTIGGAGNDLHIVDRVDDIVVENVGEGTQDRVAAAVSYTLAAGVEVEFLSTVNQAGTEAIDLTGNEFANSITGNAGINVLDGGTGNDILFGLAGDDLGLGGSGDDRLGGGSGLDLLIGDDGNDILNGEAGVDVTVGGLGDDSHYVDSAGDVVVEAAGEGSRDRLLSTVSYVLSAGEEVELLSTTNDRGLTAINLTGNEIANMIWGNDGSNTLNGSAGDDVLTGYDGDDVLLGGTGNDRLGGGLGNDRYYIDSNGDLVLEAIGQGSADRILAESSHTLAAAAEVELMTTTNDRGVAAINLTGNGFANMIWGNDGSNTLNGGGGSDVLTGYSGNDILIGGAGNDRMGGGAGSDVFRFATGSGSDVITDFDSDPAGGQDLLDISGLGVTAATFASEVSVAQVGANTIITIDAERITLNGVNAGTISATDFLFG